MTTTNIDIVSPDAVNGWIVSGKAFVLIHTLPGDHFQRVHLPGAVNACVFEVSFMEQVLAITRNKQTPIVVYGDSADTMDAAVAAEKLKREGFVCVYVLEGGLQLWRQQGFALEGGDREPPVDSGVPALLQDGPYRLDPESSVVEWTGRNPNTRHFGTLNLSKGSLVADNGCLSGKFKIDMRTIESVNLKGDELQPVLEAHLKSDDFFFVKLFPEARFNLTSARPVENATYTLPNFQVDGNLELRGVSAPLAFAANLFQAEDGGIVADAHFDFDRTRWGIIYGSSRFFKHLGMHVVYDLISVQLQLKLLPGQVM